MPGSSALSLLPGTTMHPQLAWFTQSPNTRTPFMMAQWPGNEQKKV